MLYGALTLELSHGPKGGRGGGEVKGGRGPSHTQHEVLPFLQVVLPMLDSAVVGRGWISEADFLTGIALVQAMPGPLFNIAAYVGEPPRCKLCIGTYILVFTPEGHCIYTCMMHLWACAY